MIKPGHKTDVIVFRDGLYGGYRCFYRFDFERDLIVFPLLCLQGFLSAKSLFQLFFVLFIGPVRAGKSFQSPENLVFFFL